MRLSWEAENRNATLLRGFDALAEALLAGRTQQAQRVAADNLALTSRHVRAVLTRREEIHAATLVMAG